MDALLNLSAAALADLASALDAGRLKPPFAPASLERYVPRGRSSSVAGALSHLSDAGLGAAGLSAALRLVLSERQRAKGLSDRVGLVWSGPDGGGSQSRGTATVVRELFRQAKRDVLVVSYAIDPKPEKVSALFGDLAKRMDAEPALQVRLCLNVQRPFDDTTPAEELLKAFTTALRTRLWPGKRLPEVYHDPRALAVGHDQRACLHAKFVVVDGETAFVTSANFTEAAHARNIEVGVRLEDPHLAGGLVARVEALIAEGGLVEVFG